jgi:flavin reductase (DIM6/NTAB) family NADH-FMN oxidoreductase RutF
MNASAASLPRGKSEFDHARLETAPSKLVKPPRVAASPASFECRVTELVKLKDLEGRDSGRRLVLGLVVGVHIDERFVQGGRVDSAGMRPIARGGYDEYSVVDRVFSMPRPA